MTSTDLATRDNAAVTVATTINLPELFRIAIEKGSDGVEAIERLQAVLEHQEKRSAELQFSLDLAEFQRECPPIEKKSSANISTGSGAGFKYAYADFETIVAAVRPLLSKYGFSFTFDSDTDGAMLKCTCILRHANGHREQSSFRLPTANRSAASDQQKVGGALTYAKRQTLISVLGLSLTDPEPEPAKSVETVSEDQGTTIEALLEETGVTREKFCARFKVERVHDLPSSLYAEAVRLLEAKRKGAKS